MGLNARNKGQRGEREIIDTLQPILDRVCLKIGRPPILLQRNQMQSHTGGHDIVGLAWLALEVKRVENISPINAWWEQCKRQALTAKAEPVLIYRPSHQPWKIKMYAHLPLPCGQRNIRMPATVDLASFLLWFEHSCQHHLESDKKLFKP